MTKRKAEDELQGESMWDQHHGMHWLRGELIGEGRCASVFLATRKKKTRGQRSSMLTNLPAVMAVKSAEMSDSAFIEHEAEVLSEIKGCPFVVDCFGEETTSTDEGDEVYNLLLEYASGGTLDDLIEQSNGRGLPKSQVRRYTRCILEGLKHIHKCDYVHCNLKPENILLVRNRASTSSGNPTSFVAKIADFGFAKKSKDNYGEWRGTRLYQSPEALEDNKQDKPSDIWSLGCIVLEMLTGKSLSDLDSGCDYSDFDDRMTWFDHVSTPKIPAEITGTARDFLKSCLAVRPSRRLTAEELLFHSFVAQPQPSKPARCTKGKMARSSLCHAGYNKSSVVVPRIPPPPGFETAAGS
ncbi:hypothetical protein ACFX13_006791 [Malus domestica]